MSHRKHGNTQDKQPYAVVNDTVRVKEIAAVIQVSVSVKTCDVWGVIFVSLTER